jgi:hypothetical protein
MKMSRVATFNVSQINVSYFLFFHKTSLKPSHGWHEEAFVQRKSMSKYVGNYSPQATCQKELPAATSLILNNIM